MQKTIYLHGSLAELHPEPITVEAATVAEAIRSLKMVPELQPKEGEFHQIRIEGVDNQVALFSETEMSEIHVYPLTGGAGGNNGLTQILLGIALVTLAIINPAFLAAGAKFGITQASLFLTGGLMIAGGIMQMLMPTPEAEGNKSSKFLSASENTVQIGTPITLAYGTNRLGGHYLSFDVDSFDYAGDDAPIQGLPLEGDGRAYVQHDGTSMQFAVVNPIYPSATTSPTSTPVSGWQNL